MIKQTLVAACVVIPLACFCNCDEPESTLPEKAEVKTGFYDCVIDNVYVRVPVYGDKEISEETHKLDLEYVKAIHQNVTAVSRAFLFPQKKGHIRDQFNSIKDLGSSLDKMRAGLKRINRYADFAPDYCTKVGQLIREIIGSQSAIKLGAVQANQRIAILMRAVEELVRKSHTGLYLDYAKMTLNEENMVNYMAPVVRYYRDNGYNVPLKMCEAIADGVEIVSNIKRRIPEFRSKLKNIMRKEHRHFDI